MAVLEKKCAPTLAKEARFCSDNTARSTLVVGIAIVSTGDADSRGMLRVQLSVRMRTEDGDQHDRQNSSHLNVIAILTKSRRRDDEEYARDF